MKIRRRLAALAVAFVIGLAVNQGIYQWASTARRTALADLDASRARLATIGDLRDRLESAARQIDGAAAPGAVVPTRDDIARMSAAVATDVRRLSSLSEAPMRQVLAGTADEVRDLFADWDGAVAEATVLDVADAHLARARWASQRLAYESVPRMAQDEEATLAAAQAAMAALDGRIAGITWSVFAATVLGVLGAVLWVGMSGVGRDGALVLAPTPEAPRAQEARLVTPKVPSPVVDAPVVAPPEPGVRDVEKMQAIGRLAGGVAHDFNNLLTIIKGHTERLLEAAGTQPARIRLEEVQRAADRAAALTSQLLAFSRRQVMAPRIISLNHVVSDLQSLLRPLLGERITLELELDHGLWPVRADPGQLAQVVMNLVVNARDAMPEGGAVVIRTANVAQGDPRVKQEALSTASLVSLSVRDSGVGMDEATQRHIFEPFFTTKGIGQGTGMGLSTAHGIIGQSGGEILISSAPGKGSTFTIMLPRVLEDSSAPMDSDEERRATTNRIPGIRPW